MIYFRLLGVILIATLAVMLQTCSLPTYYEKNFTFNEAIYRNDYVTAEKIFDEKADKKASGKNRFLHFVNGGMLKTLQGDYTSSNEYYEKAYLFTEDERKKFLQEGGALLLNPNLSTYFGEDHEVLMVNYFKALNYTQLGDYEAALVECRRLNLRLQQLSDKYKSDKKYKRDAFIHTLMGILYDISEDYNNAFIAYRNAVKIYEEDYSTLFNLGVPEQLKKDVIRTADLTGIWDERDRYIKKFNIEYTRPPKDELSMFVLWNDGLGPVKVETGLNFAIIHNGGGWVTFVNEKYGMSFPYYIGSNDLSGLNWIKIVVPTYVERPLLFDKAIVKDQSGAYELDKAENLNAIAFKIQKERALIELGEAVARVALKQVAAYQVKRNNENLGTLMQVIGNVSESADTRNWQTLPHSIYYTRVPIKAGSQRMNLEMQTRSGSKTVEPITLDSISRSLIYPVFNLQPKPRAIRR
ncbi:COG3014 family protein [Sediminitomix flava]|uniref:Tetratricopeptide repeat protein n=1 Tax=Sediminitomix flava TaxID=379075 RepID=A0A315Z8V7_SEDFL|nr:hypothetical protein [Sediminitomix flava]PWJ41820.1 hypothetical protein BC781_10370 [Sediminitomix flava]